LGSKQRLYSPLHLPNRCTQRTDLLSNLLGLDPHLPDDRAGDLSIAKASKWCELGLEMSEGFGQLRDPAFRHLPRLGVDPRAKVDLGERLLLLAAPLQLGCVGTTAAIEALDPLKAFELAVVHGATPTVTRSSPR